MTLPLEFVVDGDAVSQQSRRSGLRREWRERVRYAAERAMPEDAEAVAGTIMVSIAYFYDAVDIDVDNLPKLILDALKGLVFADDAHVADLLCLKRRVAPDTAVETESELLEDSVNEGRAFTYVRVEEANLLEVRV